MFLGLGFGLWTESQSVVITDGLVNIVGQQVDVLLNQDLPPGEHNVIFDAEKTKPGMFLYKLEVASYAATKTMVLTK